MSAREWQPGDVALVDSRYVAFVWGEEYSEERLSFVYTDSDGDACSVYVHNKARPLVVIDPEDREQVERISAQYILSWLGDEKPYGDTLRITADQMQAALREFANPKPVKPGEPLGLGAVVEDEYGTRWTRADTGPSLQWAKSDNQRGVHGWADYESISAVKVLSEGVTQ